MRKALFLGVSLRRHPKRPPATYNLMNSPVAPLLLMGVAPLPFSDQMALLFYSREDRFEDWEINDLQGVSLIEF
jgi:hypothetical protein